MISLYGAAYQGSPILFDGPLDEYNRDASTLTPAQAWADLWNDINSYSSTAFTPPYSLEIHNLT